MFKKIEIPVITDTLLGDVALPEYKSRASSTMEVFALVPNKIRIRSGEFELIRTGVAFGVPKGFEILLRSSYKQVKDLGLTVLGAPLTIDANNRDELLVPVYNASKHTLIIERGMVIAEINISPVLQVELKKID
jgi:dUTP pyrophosphatase